MNNLDNETEPPPVNLAEGLQVQVKGFDKDIALTVGNDIAEITRDLSRYLPLYNVVGVTVAADYHDALASIDRGLEHGIPLKATQDEELGEGIGMAVPVIRDAMVKTHIVLGSGVVGLFVSKNEEDRSMGIKLVVHELAHAADHEFKQQAFGDACLQSCRQLIPDVKEQYLWELCSSIWNEYYASRVSVPYDNQEEPYEDELFSNALVVFRDRLRDARREYHLHRINLEDFLSVLAYNLRIVLLSAGYLFGLQDASDADLVEIAPRSAPLFEEPEGQMILRFHSVLLDIWERRGKWESYDEFLELNRPTEKMLNDLDIYLSITLDNQVYIDIPASAEHII